MKDYIGYLHSDSCGKNSIIYINNKKTTIGNYYNSLPEDYIQYNEQAKQYIKKVKGDKTLSFNTKTKEVENQNVMYIMKHVVKKEMFEIEVNGNKITITGDHSLIIKRNNEIMSIKPKDVLETDELIYI
jgi:intein/homing endonuclease